ncbi:hypothetical protein STEG23_016701, partial [Scotinomys teguina]
MSTFLPNGLSEISVPHRNEDGANLLFRLQFGYGRPLKYPHTTYVRSIPPVNEDNNRVHSTGLLGSLDGNLYIFTWSPETRLADMMVHLKPSPSSLIV